MVIQKILIVIILFISVPIGYKLNGFLKEEIKEGKKYIHLTQNVLFGLILLPALLYSIKINLFLSIAIIGGILGFIFLEKIKNAQVFFGLTILLTLLVSIESMWHYVQATMLFLTGLVIGLQEKN